MRYRSYGPSEVAVSAITLDLLDAPGKGRAADWCAITFAGLENGINAFDVQAGASPSLLAGVGEALSALERRLSFVTLRCRVAAGDLERGVTLRAASEAAERLGLDRFNCLMLEGEHLEGLSRTEIERLTDLREIAQHIGVSGDERIDALAQHSSVDAVATAYSLASPIRDRSRVRALGASGKAVVTYNAFPQELIEPPKVVIPGRGLFGKPVVAPAGGYDFLRNTFGWAPEQICLAYLLTEPGVTSVRFACTDPKRIASLAAAVDRDVPGGLGAQVEMARFTDAPVPAPVRRRA